MFVYAQMILFHVLGLSPLRPSDLGSGPIPCDGRRLVLLVPQSGLSLLREFQIPRVYMSVTGASQQFEVWYDLIQPVTDRVAYPTLFMFAPLL